MPPWPRTLQSPGDTQCALLAELQGRSSSELSAGQQGRLGQWDRGAKESPGHWDQRDGLLVSGSSCKPRPEGPGLPAGILLLLARSSHQEKMQEQNTSDSQELRGLSLPSLLPHPSWTPAASSGT